MKQRGYNVTLIDDQWHAYANRASEPGGFQMNLMQSIT